MNQSHRHRRGDLRVSLIIGDLEILELVIGDGLRFAIDNQSRRRKGLAAELQSGLFQMVQVDVAISPGPDEFACVKVALLGDHVSQQRIGSDVEWDAEKYVRRPLVKLAGDFAIDDVKLEKRMAGLQPHLI